VQHAVSLVLLLSTALLVVLAFHAYRRRGEPGPRLLLFLVLVMAWWTLAYALEINAAGLAGKVFWSKVKLAGVVTLPPLLLVFALWYGGRDRWISARSLALLFAPSLLTLVDVWVQGTQGLVWGGAGIRASGPLPTLELHYEPLFWVFIVYSYTLLLLGSGLLISNLIGSHWVYRFQSAILLFGVVIPWAANALNLLDRRLVSGLDITPFAFPLTAAALAAGLWRLRLLDLVPIARDTVTERMRDGVIVLDSQYRVLDLNPAAERILGRRASRDVGQTIYRITAGREPLLDATRARRLIERYRKQGEAYEEVRLGQAPEMRTYSLALSSLSTGPERNGEHLMMLHDVTERKVVEDHLDRLAHYDTLTSLPNRRLFYERVERAIALARRKKGRLALFFLDLDRFKSINDTLGHEVGDLLLKEVAARIGSCLRDTDTVSRLGGDEFTVLLPEAADTADVASAAQRIIEAFATPFELEDHCLSITTSIGVALYPADGKDRSDLMKKADNAMYRAKTLGKNRFEFYREEIAADARDQMEIEDELGAALRNNEFKVYYQPLMACRSSEAFGVEALLRWEHPERGLLYPAEFLPVAEKAGLIVEIGQFVLAEACACVSRWHEENASDTPLKVCVNLSGRQLRHPGLVSDVVRILRETGLNADDLVLEATEDALLESDSADVLERLKSLGVLFAIDDFGTGRSALSTLSAFPADLLKVDGSLTARIGRDRESKAVASAIVNLAHALDMKVVAEGVEGADQLAIVSGMGCDLVQGYYLAEATAWNRVHHAISLIGYYYR
jgi:diguanylate cyclase (GGDEF)-like protein/PAS domain S-box-containing protein